MTSSPADLVPRLWTRITPHFQSSFIDLFHECCKMGLGDLLQMSTSMIAAFCVHASSEPAASASLVKLLTIIRSRDYLSHATPAIATVLLHAAICFRSDSALAAVCSESAAAVVNACCSSDASTSGGGVGLWPAFNDGSAVALAWCALHIFVDTKTGHSSASSACSALWSKMLQLGVVAAQATPLCAVARRGDIPSMPITQRLIRVLDALPLQGQLASDADSAIPWPVRHHLSWMMQADSELLLQQLIPLWISRSSFQPLWILQCAALSPGDPLRYLPYPATRACVHSRLLQALGYSSASFVAHQEQGAS